MPELVDDELRDLLGHLRLASDPRTRLPGGDFFAMAGTDAGGDPATPGRRFHAILLDVDRPTAR